MASGDAGLGITGVITWGLRLGVVVTVGLGTVAVYIAVCRAKKLPPTPMIVDRFKQASQKAENFAQKNNCGKR